MLVVQADCNRGRGTWKSPDDVSLELGPLAMTRARCTSKIYDRFVRDLADIRSYVTLHAGRALTSRRRPPA